MGNKHDSKYKEETLKEIAIVRDYVLSVISIGVAMGRGSIDSQRLDFERMKLAEHEKKIVDVLMDKP